MANRYYSNTAVETTLSSTISSGSTSITVGAVTGFPASYPYTLEIDPDGTMELVTVTAGASNTLTVSRGVDNTSAQAHDAGVVVRHAVSARDFKEPQDHIAATTDVHGLASGAAIVGTTSTQTLSNKTLNSPTISDFANATHDHSGGTGGGVIAHASLTGLTGGDPHPQYQSVSQKGVASGYAPLDGSVLLPTTNLPNIPFAKLPTGDGADEVAIGVHTHPQTLGLVATAVDANQILGAGDNYCATADFATAADAVYRIDFGIPYYDPDGAANVQHEVNLEYSVNGGTDWDEVDLDATNWPGVFMDFNITSAGSGMVTSGASSRPWIPGANAAIRLRLQTFRITGSITAEARYSYIHVYYVGVDLR